MGAATSYCIEGCREGPEEDEGLCDVKAISADELAGHFNLWLLTGYLPSQLLRGQTVLLLKCEGAGDLAKYRPIMMSDMVGRCFHRILAKQMEVSLPFNTRKKAFCAGDSIADSVWFIQAVIKHHQDGLRPLNVAFMDVKKVSTPSHTSQSWWQPCVWEYHCRSWGTSASCIVTR